MTQATDRPCPLVDTHAHLTWHSFDDLPAVLERAREAGLIRILTVATDLVSAEEAIAQAGEHAGVFAAVGIHPNDVSAEDEIDRLRELVRRPGVVAIGETGLDFYRHATDPALQRRRLDQHLDLAVECGLPAVIHNRQADAEIVAALAARAGRVRGVLHCFSGDEPLARRALDLGLYLSFAGNLTYPSASQLRAVAGWIPEERLLVETDAPFLSPVPRRGSRNEPAHVGYTLRALAGCRGRDEHELAASVAANARALFGW